MRMNAWGLQTSLEMYGRAAGPQTRLTALALILNGLLVWLYIPLLPVQIVTTAAFGLLSGLTFGVSAILVSLVWQVFLWPLVGTSWLWAHVPPLRPFLLVPGAVWANIANAFVSLVGDPEMDAKATKLALCASWPNSFYIMWGPAGGME